MRIPALLFILLLATNLCAQDYDDFMRKAEELYDAGMYMEASKYLDTAFLINSNPHDYDDFYNAACSYSLAGITEKALYYLEKSFINGYDDLEFMENDPDLDNIRSTEKYRSILITHLGKFKILIYAADTSYDNMEYHDALKLYDSAFNTGEQMPNALMIKIATLCAELDFKKNAFKYLEELFQSGYNDISFVILNSKFKSLWGTVEFNDLISRFSDPNTIYTHTLINDLIDPLMGGTLKYDGKTININLSPYLADTNFIAKYGLSFDRSNYLKLIKSIEISNCQINAFSLNKSTIPKIELVGNTSKNQVVYISSLQTNILELRGNTFDELYLSGININEDFSLMNHSGSVSIDNSKIDMTELLIIQGNIPVLTISSTKFNETTVEIWDEQTGEEYGNIVFEVTTDELEISGNTFNCDVILNNSTIKSNLLVQENKFLKYFDIHNAIMPELNMYLPYRQFSKGFAVFTDIPAIEYFTGIECKYCIKYSGSSLEDFGNIEDFDKLIRSLQIVNKHYG